MIAKSKDNKALHAFIAGRAKKVSNTVSTGKELFLFGNKIAEWKQDGLYISNGGYLGHRGQTGSVTTKSRLNELPNVSIHQKNNQWFLNGVEWDGEWVKVEGTVSPEIEKGSLNFFNEARCWVANSAWRGYVEPVYAIVGANDTGNWDDSPCPSGIRDKELNAIKEKLLKHGIPTKQMVCESSNVFCVHVYLIAKMKDVEAGRDIVRKYLTENDTRLAYVVNGVKEEAA